MITLNQCLQSLVVALALFLGACSQQAPSETWNVNSSRQAPSETLTIDSSNAQIVTSNPASSEATCTFSEEPVLVIGDDEEDDNQWFSGVV